MEQAIAQLIRNRRHEILVEWQIAAVRPRRAPLPAGTATDVVLGQAFDGLVAVLGEGEHEVAERFLAMAATKGVLAGVDAGEAIRALLAFKGACITSLRRTALEPPELLAAWEALDEITGWAVGRLGDLYAAQVSEIMANQVKQLRESEERLQFQATELSMQGRELERRVKAIQALNRSAAEVNSSLEPDKVLRLIAEHAARLMETNLCAVYEWDPETSKMSGRTAVGVDWDAVRRIAAAVTLDPTAIRAVIARRHPLAVPDLEVAEAMPPLALATAREQGIRAALAAPLVAHGQFFGYLATYYPFRREFAPHEVDLLSAFAEHGAMALQNARLFAGARRLAAAEERNRIAGEVHDTLAQSLTGLLMQLQGTARLLGRDGERDRRELKEAIAIARRALQEARNSVWELREDPLGGASLAEAVRSEVEKLEGEQVRVEFAVVGEEPGALGGDVVHNLLRIAQEALANVRRHARATRVRVSLRFAESAVELFVADDGIGFSAANQGAEGSHFGLSVMNQRARLLGGELNVASAQGQGTQLTVIVPLARKREEREGD